MDWKERVDQMKGLYRSRLRSKNRATGAGTQNRDRGVAEATDNKAMPLTMPSSPLYVQPLHIFNKTTFTLDCHHKHHCEVFVTNSRLSQDKSKPVARAAMEVALVYLYHGRVPNEEDISLAELSRRMQRDDIDDVNMDGVETNEDDEVSGVLFLDKFIPPEAIFNASGLRFNEIIGKVRKTVKLFRKAPRKYDDVLQKHVVSEFGREYALLLDSRTRWSSMAVVLERFLKFKASITKALID
nr:unnamed protein product [Callosobruchus chinensis]